MPLYLSFASEEVGAQKLQLCPSQIRLNSNRIMCMSSPSLPSLSLEDLSFLIYQCVLVSAQIQITPHCAINSIGLFWENQTVWSSLLTPWPRAFLSRQYGIQRVADVLLGVTRGPNSPELCLYPQEQRRCLCGRLCTQHWR